MEHKNTPPNFSEYLHQTGCLIIMLLQIHSRIHALEKCWTKRISAAGDYAEKVIKYDENILCLIVGQLTGVTMHPPLGLNPMHILLYSVG